MSVRIISGDCRSVLATLPDESVHCVVTSPPYWGLRCYGVEGQLGQEQTIAEHVVVMTDVFREVRRVLRRDGTLWLNYGDCYIASPPGNKLGYDGMKSSTLNGLNEGARYVDTRGVYDEGQRRSSRVEKSGDGLYGRKLNLQIGHGEDRQDIWGIKGGAGLKPKNLVGMPWRVAFALQADGWYLRQDIIWSKPNPMPESVRDRCTKAHEYIFLLSKNEQYYYDAEAIKEGSVTNDPRRPYGSPGANALDPRNRQGNGELRDESSSRNKRSVWEVTTQPFSEAHFATFPPALIEPCILAGCPKGGTVLDPFGGAGTTGLVADRLQRDAILIELKPEYAEMARRRIQQDAPLFVVQAAE